MRQIMAELRQPRGRRWDKSMSRAFLQLYENRIGRIVALVTPLVYRVSGADFSGVASKIDKAALSPFEMDRRIQPSPLSQSGTK